MSAGVVIHQGIQKMKCGISWIYHWRIHMTPSVQGLLLEETLAALVPWPLLPPYLCYLRTSVTPVPPYHCCFRTSVTSVPLLPPYLCYLRTSVTPVPPYYCYLRTSVASVSLLLLHSFESPTVQDTYSVQLLTPVSCCKLTGKPSSSLLHEDVHVWSCNLVNSHRRAFFQDYTSLLSGMKILCIVSWWNLMQEHCI